MRVVPISNSMRISRHERIELAYDRFLREGHIGALTLGGYFPALIFGYLWLISPNLHEPRNALTAVTFLVAGVSITIIWFYGIVGLTLGRKKLQAVLAGNQSWRNTVLIVLGAYVIDTGYYALTHKIVARQTNVTFSIDALLFFVEICIFAPLSEELAFQGFLQTRLQCLGGLPAMLITTIMFVCIHVSALARIPTTFDIVHLFEVMFPSLLVLAAVRQYTGSLFAAIVLHFLGNATILFIAAFVKVA